MKIIHTIEIESTPEQVFDWLEESSRAMQWMTSVSKTEIIQETPNRVGTTFRETIEEDGRGTEMRGVITDFVPNERLAFHLEGDFNTVEVCFTLEEKAGITQLTQRADVRFKGLLKIMSLFFGSAFKRKIMSQTQSEFARLKELCERDVSNMRPT